ncbi:hypothetical protein C8F04DRAFT_144052 [Mycena alexandri]|uniref:MYND-type domain-containing protein n=1 Tax=Mycena alexandri TaxID=1745969 RepID=A0AAD6T9T4_9AGAR|nr:hypothetical protein C8F04DRAFT_144052 [Mycena alexandri]
MYLAGSFKVLRWLALNTSPHQQWLAEAIEAGLLRTVVSETTKRLRTTAVSGAFLLASQKNSLPKVESLIKAQRFTASPMATDWSHIFGPCLKLLQIYNTDIFHSVRGCDNLACGQIKKRPDFKCCGACRQRYYCSETCQRRDWQSDHGLVCSLLHDALCLSIISGTLLTIRTQTHQKLSVRARSASSVQSFTRTT